MTLIIEQFVGGPIETNAWLLIDGESRDAILIDAPWGITDEVIARLAEHDATLKKVVLTHAHWDHIGAAMQLAHASGAEISAHELARDRLLQPASSMVELPFVIPPVAPDRWTGEGDQISVGSHLFTVMHLPGHDPAHIALYSEADGLFFGGDVVFPNGHGRIDIPGADEDDMTRSLARVAALPPAVVVYPGHGETTTVGDEEWLQRFRARAARLQDNDPSF